MTQATSAVGHDWEWLNAGRSIYKFARQWRCRTCGRHFTGENPPEGICSMSLVPKAKTFAGPEIERVVFEVLTTRYGVAQLEGEEAAADIVKALEAAAAPKGGTENG